MGTNFWELLHQRQDQLTRSGHAVADYLLQHADEAQYLSISSLARECNVAEATVFRFCRALGFDGYHEMRIALAQANATGTPSSQRELQPGATTAELCEHAYARFLTAINGTQNALSTEAVDEAVHLMQEARQVFCLGQGGSMLLANDICARFASLSTKFRTAGDSHLQLLTASLMNEADVVLFVSYSGDPRHDGDTAHRQGRRGKDHPPDPLRGLPRRIARRCRPSLRRTGKPAGLRQHPHQGSIPLCRRSSGAAVYAG